jgi:hypothetical protein
VATVKEMHDVYVLIWLLFIVQARKSNSPIKGETYGFRVLKNKEKNKNWIPAFAGMTMVGDAHPTRPRSSGWQNKKNGRLRRKD